jgi:hypothetical protein
MILAISALCRPLKRAFFTRKAKNLAYIAIKCKSVCGLQADLSKKHRRIAALRK